VAQRRAVVAKLAPIIAPYLAKRALNSSSAAAVGWSKSIGRFPAKAMVKKNLIYPNEDVITFDFHRIAAGILDSHSAKKNFGALN